MGTAPQAPSTVTVSAEIVKTTQSNIDSLRERANAIQVKTPQEYVQVCNLVIEGRGFIKRWQEVFAGTIRSAKEHLATIQNELKGHVIEAEAVVAIAEKKAEDYRVEEKRIKEADQKRQQEEADRAKLQKAEEDRRAAEKEAAEKKKATIADVNARLKEGSIGKREAARLLKAAGAEAEAAVQSAAAAEEEAKKAPTPVVKVEAAIPKVAGIKGRTNWKWRWKKNGEHDLIDALLKDSTKRIYVQGNETAIGELVRSVKDKTKAEALIPGIEVYSEESI
jgi:hypothetical protein